MKKKDCEFLRFQARQKFDRIRGTWLDCGKWALPHRTRWLMQQQEGERNNHHIVDVTHKLALRSFVAGHLEGNTSATRPWYQVGVNDEDLNMRPENRDWLYKFTRRTLQVLSSSNFYDAAGFLYYDYGTYNTGTYYIEKIDSRMFFHTLLPGSYYVIDNGYSEAVILVREFTMHVKALVDTYGKKDPKTGKVLWNNFSSGVKKLYEDGNYTIPIEVVHIIKENPDFNPNEPQALLNRKWISYTYEVGGQGGQYVQGQEIGANSNPDPRDEDKYLNVSASRYKPFIVAKSTRSFEYGEQGPTLDALGLIKSLNKKAISKDQALEQILRPAIQGPANLRKSYMTTQSNSYVPIDPMTLAKGGLKSIYEVNPAIAHLLEDCSDLRQMVDKLYYADYLLYLSRNPKTRTATETNAIVQEQQLIIGPNLQSLHQTHNVPIVELVMDHCMFEDEWIDQNPVPDSLQGNFLKPTFISVFAQAQKAADLPSIERYIGAMMEVAQLNPQVFDKVNLDKLADLYEDRLFLPAGLNNPQAKVDAMREQALAQRERQQMLQETLPAMAGAAKDVGLKVAGNEQ
jgi:hypothetical protein